MLNISGRPGVAIAALLLIAAFVLYWARSPELPPVPDIRFDNATATAGLVRHTPSFAVVATDLDNDGIDDLVVGHHGYPPAFYLNKGGRFTEAADIHPLKKRDDRHGYTFVDLDNDGDRDFVYAGGGADGLGKGSPNRVFQNMLIETGQLRFDDISGGSDIAYPTWRSRHLRPIANTAGDKVDLYLSAIHRRREGSTNLYVANDSTPGNIALAVDRSSSLNLPLDSDGKDLFFDFDRDGQTDYLNIGRLRATLYRNSNGNFTHLPSALDDLVRVVSAVVADLNNDGYPDLYLGATSGHSDSDNVSANSEEIHFSIVAHKEDAFDSLSFRTDANRLRFDFQQHIPSEGKPRTDASDIFIGKAMKNPPKRKGNIQVTAARGAPPSMDKAGTYIWFDPAKKLWHVHWRHDAAKPVNSKGIIYAKNMVLLDTDALEVTPMRQVKDYLLINQRGQGWKRLNLPELKHDQWTNYLTAADFNNDGLIDIAGVRTRDDAKPNGTPFLLINRGRLHFAMREILQNSADDIFRADAIVHGFFNDDGLPDLFYTNGFGLMPGHFGPYQLWLNTTAEHGGHVLIELQGNRSNRDAIGAQVELYDKDGKLLGYRELGPAYGRGQDTHKLHFGLGQYNGPMTLKVLWPGDDKAQTYTLTERGLHHVIQN